MFFIPDKLKVGFQEENSNGSKIKLAYVTYLDEKGNLRKEMSWNDWKDNNIQPEDFSNEPLGGFVLDESVGGVEGSYGRNVRKTWFRIFDPRGFDIEIDTENLIYIIKETGCLQGGKLVGDFLYGWRKGRMFLIPKNSEMHKQAIRETLVRKKFSPIKKRDLVVGRIYGSAGGEKYLYMGEFPEWSGVYSMDGKPDIFGDGRVKDPEIVNKNSLFFIYLGQKRNWLECFKAIPKKIVYMLDDIPSPSDMGKYTEILERSCRYSPIDLSRDEIVSVPFSIFEATINEDRKQSKSKKQNRILYFEGECSEDDWIDFYPIEFRKDGSIIFRGEIVTDISEVYNKIHPKMGRRYLKNGNVYKIYKYNASLCGEVFY